MTGLTGPWRHHLVLAAAVEAACGLAAASWANALHAGHSFFVVFTACAAAAAVADMVLVPGCVWRRDPSVPLRLATRLCAAAGTLLLAAVIGVLSFFPAYVVVSIVRSFGVWEPALRVIWFGTPFLVGGAVAGLGAAVADSVDTRLGLVQARKRSHVAGGIAGAMLVLGLSIACAATGATEAGPWAALFVLAPAVLVVAGGLRHGLMARDAARTGAALAMPGPAVRPALACCAACCLLAAAAPFVAASCAA